MQRIICLGILIFHVMNCGCQNSFANERKLIIGGLKISPQNSNNFISFRNKFNRQFNNAHSALEATKESLQNISAAVNLTANEKKTKSQLLNTLADEHLSNLNSIIDQSYYTYNSQYFELTHIINHSNEFSTELKYYYLSRVSRSCLADEKLNQNNIQLPVFSNHSINLEPLLHKKIFCKKKSHKSLIFGLNIPVEMKKNFESQQIEKFFFKTPSIIIGAGYYREREYNRKNSFWNTTLKIKLNQQQISMDLHNSAMQEIFKNHFIIYKNTISREKLLQNKKTIFQQKFANTIQHDFLYQINLYNNDKDKHISLEFGAFKLSSSSGGKKISQGLSVKLMFNS